MTKSLSDSPTQNKPPDPIITSTSSLSKSSLTCSSTASLSPSTSILFSAAANRSSVPSGKKGQSPIPPLSSSSSSSTINDKLESIIQNFYTKTAQIIIQSRVPNTKNTLGNKRINKWFNISTNDNDKLKEELTFWKSLVKYQQEEQEPPPPPLVIDIYLETTVPDLLQEGDDIHGRHKLDFGLQQNNVQRVLIESWTLSLNHPLPDCPVDLPNLYKRSVVFFRSLHWLVRILPGHSLYQRSRLHDEEISLGYRLSTTRSNRKDEISLDHALTNVDTIQMHEFKEISTPLGTFKLKLLFREHCQFDIKEESPLHCIDVDENFFTPTMTKYRLEKGKEKAAPLPVPVLPTASSTASAKSRLQSYRGTAASRSNLYPMTSISFTTSASSTNNNASHLERRISAPLVSPFKSPSLSSSPQTELMLTTHSRSNTPERFRPESGSFGRKPEFSSSFEKFFVKGNNSGSSNVSVGSSHQIQRTGSSNNVTAGDTIAGISMTRRWSRASDHSSINLESEEEDDLVEFLRSITARQDLKLFQQQTAQPPVANNTITVSQQQQSARDETMKCLSHFRNIQETHTILSDSMSFSQQQSKPQHQQNECSYESSSSSLTKGLNLPAIPSPLHNTESAIHPTATTGGKVPSTDSRNFNDPFFNGHPADIVTCPPLKNRRAPLPPIPPTDQRRISNGCVLDDDDSLVFKMSELIGCDEHAPNSDHHINFYYGSDRDGYLQKLTMAAAFNVDMDDDTHNEMRKAASTGGTPLSVVNAAAILDCSDSSSKSDPIGSSGHKFKTIQQDQGNRLTRRLFYDES